MSNCTIPPAGWYCTRGSGHEGPCAAIPYRTPYGALSSEPEFDLAQARIVLANLEHEPANQANEDTLWVELRLACDAYEELENKLDRIMQLCAPGRTPYATRTIFAHEIEEILNE